MITAIIVNYHSRELTARAAASVVTDCPDAQIIVIDNSEDAVEAAELRVLLPPQADCYIPHHNLGFGQACNLGFEKAHHDWIFLLNPDAWVLPGCIKALTEFMMHTPQAAAAAPLTCWDTEQRWLLPPAQLPTPATELGMALALRHPWLGRLLSLYFRRWSLSCIRSQQPVRQRMLSGGVVMLRRAAVQAAGGLFDPDFFMYFEDTDLCRRLHKAGFQLYLVPAARAIHAWESAPEKAALSVPSRLRYFQKQFSGSILFALSQRLDQQWGSPRLSASNHLGVCQAPPDFPVPPELQGDWVLEISPNPLLMPALYCFGNGNRCRISEEVWPLLGPGCYWGRLAGLDGKAAVQFSWNIK